MQKDFLRSHNLVKTRQAQIILPSNKLNGDAFSMFCGPDKLDDFQISSHFLDLYPSYVIFAQIFPGF